MTTSISSPHNIATLALLGGLIGMSAYHFDLVPERIMYGQMGKKG